MLCQWYAFCVIDAVGTVHHPILGDVPTCQRCATKHELDLVPYPVLCECNGGPPCDCPDCVHDDCSYRALADNVQADSVVDPELLAKGAALARELGLDTGS